MMMNLLPFPYSVIGDVGNVVKLLQVDSGILLGLFGGLAIVGVLLLAYKAILAFRDRAQSVPFLEKVKGAMARTPSVVADPAKRARLDDLRKKYEEGVEKFRQAGKDLHSLPWYLLVGPAGSGKTEAMRHCKIGFPPGLQDCFQGAGGTMNMHWWFTNYAVVLDTAGRMFMEDAALQGGSEWREFLKLLKQSRPNAPVNGMLLVIGIDSLIKDTAEQIEGKAGHIAKQLDTIQRTLDVRFPVYVVITKCDLMTGFKEFFDKIDDPQLQHQILGWSNPAPLDEPFRAEAVDDHVKTIRSRLLKRRATLLMDPVHTEDPQARRTDQVDELFALPDNIAKIAPRLRRYLEIIFQAGEWSPKPLFLRGIYFTSSMRQGKALDEDLAAALGISVDAIPGGKVYDEERSFFLRDVFMSKVFREKGLVTRATNVQREQAGRKRLVMGAAIVVTIALTALTLFSSGQLRSAVREPLETWTQVAKSVEQSKVIDRGISGPEYFGNKEAVEVERGNKITPLELIDRAKKQSESPVSMGFLSFGRVLEDVNSSQLEAYQAVVIRAVAAPMLSSARSALASRDVKWTPEASAALGELVAAEIRALDGTPARDLDAKDAAGKGVNPAPILAFVSPTASISKDELAQLKEALSVIPAAQYASHGLAGTPETLEELKKAIAQAGEAWKEAAANGGDLGELMRLEAAIKLFLAAESDLWRQIPERAVGTIEEYNTFATRYAQSVTKLETAAAEGKLGEVAGVWPRLGGRTEADLVEAAKRNIQSQADAVVSGLPRDVKAEADKKTRAGIAADAIKTALAAALESGTKGLPSKVAEVRASLAEESRKSLVERGRTADTLGFQDVIALYKDLVPFVAQADSGGNWIDAAARVGEINAAGAKVSEDVQGWINGVSPMLKGQKHAQVAQRVVEVARGGRVGARVGAFLAGIDSGKSVSEVVAAAAGAPVPTTKIGMSGLDGVRVIEAAYSPAVVGNLFLGWRATLDELSGPKKDWLVGDGLADRSKRLSTPMTEYGREYAASWKATLAQSNAREFATWTEFHAALETKESPNPVDVHVALKGLHEQVQRDLSAIGSALGSDEIRKDAEAAGKQAALITGASDPTIADKIDRVRRKLRGLGGDPRKAREGLLAMLSPDSPDGQALADFVSSASVPGYWQTLVVRGFDALAKEYQTNAASDVDRLIALSRFPLVNDRAGAPLTPAELDEAARILNELQVSDKDRRAQILGGRLSESTSRLITPDAIKNRPRIADFVARAREVCKAFSGPGGTALVESIAGDGDGDKPTESAGSIRTIADGWTVEGDPMIEGIDAGKVRKVDSGAPLQSVRLLFYKRATETVVRRQLFEPPWAAASMVLTPGAVAIPGEGSESASWRIPVVVQGEESLPEGPRVIGRHMWIKVVLKKPVPAAKNWPKKEDLGGN
jgi:hypothetical protein